MRAPAHVIRARRQEQQIARLDSEALRRHQDFIATLPCIACGKPPPSEAAQLGLCVHPENKPHLLPLCGADTVWDDCCHSRLYFRGRSRFWPAFGINPDALARRLWIVSGDRQAGERLIRQARRTITARPDPVPDRRVRPRSAEPILLASAR